MFTGLEQEKKRKEEIFPYVFFLEELQWSPRRGSGRRSGHRILLRSPRRGRVPVRSGRGRAAAGSVRLVAGREAAEPDPQQRRGRRTRSRIMGWEGGEGSLAIDRSKMRVRVRRLVQFGKIERFPKVLSYI